MSTPDKQPEPSLALNEYEQRLGQLALELKELGVDVETLLDQATGELPLDKPTGYADLVKVLGNEAAVPIFQYLRVNLAEEGDPAAAQAPKLPEILTANGKVGLNAAAVAGFVASHQSHMLDLMRAELRKLGVEAGQVNDLMGLLTANMKAENDAATASAAAAAKNPPKAAPGPQTPEAIQAEAKKKLKELEQGFDAKLKESGLEMPKENEQPLPKEAPKTQKGPASEQEFKDAGKKIQDDLSKGLDSEFKKFGMDGWPGGGAPAAK